MKNPIDLHLRPSQENVYEILSLGKEMGFKLFGISFKDGLEIQRGSDRDIVSRIDITPKNQNHFYNALNRHRKNYIIISVKCFSKKIVQQAIKDNRVDIIYLPFSHKRNNAILGKKEARIARDSNIAYEINLTELIGQPKQVQLEVMKKAKKDIRNAQKFDIPIIASSGAQEPIMMREPRALVSLLEALNIEEENAINMVTNNPSEIITRNTEKIKSKFYSPWVRRVL